MDEQTQRKIKTQCRLTGQGLTPGSCLVETDDNLQPACQVTLKSIDGNLYRRIPSIHLSRPENYLSIYQSGCNFACRKCHSWYFSKIRDGVWYSPEEILKKSVEYAQWVTLEEPRERATAWHAQESCRCCGSCVTQRKRSSTCPGIVDPGDVLTSPQGFGPARNIVAFTGGDITCCPEFYVKCTRLIKKHTDLWVLIETNGYGLTARNLDRFQVAGVDAFWLDIKAFDDDKHRWLTGCSNANILKLPGEILKRGFTLEVLSLYIPELVESDELEQIARSLAAVDTRIPFTILAFFPEYKMKGFRSPDAREMVAAYSRIKKTGLQNIRIGNLGVFVRSEEDRKYLLANIEIDAI